MSAVLSEVIETVAAREPQAITSHLEKALKAYGGRAGLIVTFQREFQRLIGSMRGANEDPNTAKLINSFAKLDYTFATPNEQAAEWKIQMNFTEADARHRSIKRPHQW